MRGKENCLKDSDNLDIPVENNIVEQRSTMVTTPEIPADKLDIPVENVIVEQRSTMAATPEIPAVPTSKATSVERKKRNKTFNQTKIKRRQGMDISTDTCITT